MDLTKTLAAIYEECKVPCITISFLNPDGEDVKVLFRFLEELDYNRFSGKNVVAFLETLISEGKVGQFRFGREFSPVLYIQPNHWNKNEKRCYTEEENIAIRREMEAKAKDLKADEVDVVGNELRIWWD